MNKDVGGQTGKSGSDVTSLQEKLIAIKNGNTDSIDKSNNISFLDNPKKLDHTRKTWNEFQSAGLLWFINTFLHLFGWCLAATIAKEDSKEHKKGTIIEVYPARTKCRGFPVESNDIGYKRVTNFLSENISTLVDDIKD